MNVKSIYFSRISADRIHAHGRPPKVKVSSATHIRKVARMRHEDEEVVSVDFVFTSNYTPRIGDFKIEGEAFLTAENVDDLVEGKGSETRLKEKAKFLILNSVTSKCIRLCILLTEDMQMPAPVQFPHFSAKKKKNVEEVVDSSYIR